MRKRPNFATLSVVAMLALTACQQQPDSTNPPLSPGAPPAAASSAAAPTAAPVKWRASIAELMDSVIDPSADALWDSVGTTVDAKGTVQRQPRSDAEWHEARRHAIALIEGTNLLVMDGRRLVAPGAAVLDQDVQGVLSPAEGQKKFEAQHAVFVQFAYALHDVGEQMLAAIDAKDPKRMMAVGATMDEVCESCHLTFWYPNQVIPELPPTIGASQSSH